MPRGRHAVATVALAVLAAACGPDGAGDTTTTTVADATTVAPADMTTTTPRTRPEPPDAPATAIGDPLFPTLGNTGYDVDHYLVDLDYDPATDHLTAEVTITATATETLHAFSLDFTGLEVAAVHLDGAPAGHRSEGRKLVVAASPPLASGEGFSVTVAYSGTPGPASSPALDRDIGWFNTDDGAFVLAQPDGASTWYPCNDHPADRAWHTWRITVPAGTSAAASGSLVSSDTSGGTTTTVWESPAPMATYLATVVIGDHRLVVDEASSERSSVTVRNVLPAALADDPPPELAGHGEMIAHLAGLFGPYPYEEYGVAIVDEVAFGALETMTLSVFGSSFVEATERIGSVGLFELVLVHELAHHWFGNHVGLRRWGDIWLNEGFASYAEWLWLEAVEGRAFVEAALEAERAHFAGLGVAAPGRPTADTMFGPAVYRVGAMTLHALRLTVGDDAFFDVLATWVTRFGGVTATTADFVALAEEVSGRDLGGLFDSWLHGDELPAFPSPSAEALAGPVSLGPS